MKRFILFLTIIFSGTLLHAQTTTQTPDQRAHQEALRVQRLVSANDDQAKKMEAIFLSGITSVQSIKSDNSKTAEQQQTEIANVKTEKQQELSQVLTAEQYAIYQRNQAEKAARKNSGQ